MNKKKFFKTFGILTLILLVVVGGTIFATTFWWGNVGEGIDSESLDRALPNQRQNVLLLGTDEGGQRSDVIMIFSFSAQDGTINSISVPRDTRVKIGNNYQKINAALAIGEEDLAIETIRQVTGIPIHEFVKISFQGVIDAVDALGGVEFDVPQDMYKSDPPINLKKGVQVLDGEKALQLLRYRDYPQADLMRIKVQQDFMRAAFEQKAKPQYIAQIPKVYQAVSDIKSSLSVAEMTRYANMIRKAGVSSIQTYEMPVTPKMIGGISYVIVDTEALAPIVNEHFK